MFALFTDSRHAGRRRALAMLLVAFGIAVTLLAVRAAGASARTPTARAAFAQQCAENHPAQRDPSNPLDLPSPPGANPLNGAKFLVPGPRTGSAASAIAQMVGINPLTLSYDESWAHFSAELQSGSLHRELAADATLARNVALLSKIAAEPEAQRLSSYSWGGTPTGIFNQAEKIFCSIQTADPGTIPIINTYFLHATLGGSPTSRQVHAYDSLFRGRVDAMAAATDKRPAVYLLEIDGIGSTSGIVEHHSLPAWEADLRYEINKMAALPHTVVYVEGGYSDSNTVNYTAKVLNAIGVRKIRGFFTNDTHLNWTSREITWATAISRKTHGAHFIVNTADNGRGPLRNKDRIHNGNENLCNPPGRGLGPRTTTETGFKYADAFMWTHPPGNSSGCGGGPPGGVFWPARAEGLAAAANGQLGPGFPSHPY